MSKWLKYFLQIICLAKFLVPSEGSNYFEYENNFCKYTRKECSCTKKQNNRLFDISCEHRRTVGIEFSEYKLQVTCQNDLFNDFLYDLQHWGYFTEVYYVTIHNCSYFGSLAPNDIIKSLGLRRPTEFTFELENNSRIRHEKVNAQKESHELDLLLQGPSIDADTFKNVAFSLNKLTVTTYLNCTHNLWHGLFTPLQNLTTLRWSSFFYYCGIELEMFNNLDELKTLIIIFSGVKQAPDRKSNNFHVQNMTKLLYVSLSNTFPLGIDGKYFRGAINLNSIAITNNNELEYLPTDLFSDQHKLIALDLSQNALKAVEEKLFANTQKLENLNLSQNKLIHLELKSPFLPYLIKLVIIQNNIRFSELTLKTEQLQFVEFDAYDQLLNISAINTTGSICQTWIEMFTNKCDFVQDKYGHRCPHQCKCTVSRSPLHFDIDCNNAGETHENIQITALPIAIADISTLYLEHRNLTILPNISLPGYANLTRLYAGHNQLTTLALSQLPPRLTHLDISNNKLQALRADVLDFFAAHMVNLTLDGNPWLCDCETVDMLGYLKKMHKNITKSDQISCNVSGKNKTMITLEAIEICPSAFTPTLLGCTIAAIVVTSAIVILAIIYRQFIMIWLYEHNLCMWLVAEGDMDYDKRYDAFVSYSNKDVEMIYDLVPQLENGPRSYRLCLHDRDWLIGQYIPQSIAQSVAESKRIIIVLSPNFLASDWGRMEFRLAYQASMEDRCRRLIIILYKEVGDFEPFDNELKAYLKLNTFLKWDDPNFWCKLRYAMPHKGRKLRGTHNDDIEMMYRLQ